MCEQARELLRKRTELYELLLYAQKKYRETGAKQFLEDARNAQAQITDCDKVLRKLSEEE